MGRVEACRICLITDVKMERIQGSLETNIKSIFGHNIMYSSDLPDYSCYECTALITKFSKFRKKYFTAQGLLFNILQNHGVITEKEIKGIDRVASKLNSNLSTTHINTDWQEVKLKIEYDPMDDVLEKTVDDESDNSGSEDDAPLLSVRQIEYVNVGTIDKKLHSPKIKNHMSTENNSGESSNKIRKLQVSDARREKWVQDFNIAKLNMESRIRATPEQFILMIEFMERHGDLLRPQPGPQGRLKSERLWQELSEILNSAVGSGVNKTADKWKKVWSDWKSKTKKKAFIISQDIQDTGGGPGRLKPLSRLEQRVLRIIGNTAITGNEDTQDAALPVPYQPQDVCIERVPSAVDEIELFLIPSAPEDTSMSVSDDRATTPPACPVTPMPGPSNINRTRQEGRSSVSAGSSTLRRRDSGQRRLRQAPFDRAPSEFVAIEKNRLSLERERDARLFQIESERLRIEAERVRVDERRTRFEADLLESNQQLHLKMTALYDLVSRFSISDNFENHDPRPN